MIHQLVRKATHALRAIIMRFVPRLRDWPWALKLFGLLLTTAIVPVFALTLYTETVVRREAVEDEGARNLQRARNTAILIDEYLQDVLGDVQILSVAAPTREVLSGSTEIEQRAELADLLRQVTAAKNLPIVLVLDSAGRVVEATDKGFVGADRGSAAFFQSAIAGESRVHDPTYVPQDRAVFLHASVPVFDRTNRIAGVVAVRIPLSEIDHLIDLDSNFGGDGEFGMLWDQNGIVLSSPAAPDWRFRPLGSLPDEIRSELVAARRYGPGTSDLLARPGPEDGLVRHTRDRADSLARADLGGGALQLASVAIPSRRWTYAIATPEELFLLYAREQSRRNLLAALLAALAAIGLAIVCASWLARPLDQVRATAQALAAGDMHRRARLDRRDEIGQMADAFDSMADALARKDAELRMHADSLERHVSERTAELSGLLAAIPDLIFKVGRDGRVLDYSAPSVEELVLPPEAFLGRRVTDVLPPEVSLPAMAVVQRVLAGETVPPFEYQMHIGGELRQYEARGSATGGESVLFLVRNVTERRHHEERMRFLARAGTALTASLDYGNIVETLAQLPVPFMADVCVVDVLEDGVARCAAISARTPELQALVRADRADRCVDLSSDHPVAAALTKGVAHFHGRAPADGGSGLATTSIIVLPLVARGQTLGAVSFLTTMPGRRYSEADFAVAQELTHRAATALDNARLYRDIQEASRLKDEFLGIVSHELRTPLNAVLGWSQVLRRAPADAEQTRRAVLAIERNAQAQARLVEDLLDTSRVISGKIRLQPSAVDVRRLIRATVESFGPMARTAGLELSAGVGEDAGEIRADASRLQQVLGNLLSNSLKFTPAGGRVEVDVRRVASTLEIRVSDTGAGIPPEFLPHVFDRFRQADSTTTRAHGGLGLGLAIARHLVELHGGSITAVSEGFGRGSTFTIALPTEEVPAVEEPRRSSVPRPAPRRLLGARVLAVDDSEDALDLIRTILTPAGAVVAVATSVEEARKAIEEMTPDILVADIGMPAQDGYALIRYVRASEAHTGRPRLPAVALTAYARGEDRVRSAAAGYDMHLTKPVDATVLMETLAVLLERFAPRPVGEIAT